MADARAYIYERTNLLYTDLTAVGLHELGVTQLLLFVFASKGSSAGVGVSVSRQRKGQIDRQSTTEPHPHTKQPKPPTYIQIYLDDALLPLRLQELAGVWRGQRAARGEGGGGDGVPHRCCVCASFFQFSPDRTETAAPFLLLPPGLVRWWYSCSLLALSPLLACFLCLPSAPRLVARSLSEGCCVEGGATTGTGGSRRPPALLGFLSGFRCRWMDGSNQLVVDEIERAAGWRMRMGACMLDDLSHRPPALSPKCEGES